MPGADYHDSEVRGCERGSKFYYHSFPSAEYALLVIRVSVSMDTSPEYLSPIGYAELAVCWKKVSQGIESEVDGI